LEGAVYGKLLRNNLIVARNMAAKASREDRICRYMTTKKDRPIDATTGSGSFAGDERILAAGMEGKKDMETNNKRCNLGGTVSISINILSMSFYNLKSYHSDPLKWVGTCMIFCIYSQSILFESLVVYRDNEAPANKPLIFRLKCTAEPL
jgi:hypothetical protein